MLKFFHPYLYDPTDQATKLQEVYCRLKVVVHKYWDTTDLIRNMGFTTSQGKFIKYQLPYMF